MFLLSNAAVLSFLLLLGLNLRLEMGTGEGDVF